MSRESFIDSVCSSFGGVGPRWKWFNIIIRSELEELENSDKYRCLDQIKTFFLHFLFTATPSSAVCSTLFWYFLSFFLLSCRGRKKIISILLLEIFFTLLAIFTEYILSVLKYEIYYLPYLTEAKQKLNLNNQTLCSLLALSVNFKASFDRKFGSILLYLFTQGRLKHFYVKNLWILINLYSSMFSFGSWWNVSSLFTSAAWRCHSILPCLLPEPRISGTSLETQLCLETKPFP